MDAVSGYVLHLPEDESVVLSGPVVRRLIGGGDGDAALLYIAVLQNRGSIDEEKLRGLLRWTESRFRRALSVLSGQGLVGRPGGEQAGPEAPAASGPQPERRDQRPEYTRSDMARALEGAEFAALTGAVEDKLGKKLTTPDLSLLLGLYDYLGLPADVIFLLVGFCAERTAAQYGPGRRPTMRQIEREGYTWARLGLMTQESASAYIRRYQSGREQLPRLMKLLRLGDRAPSPTEERYLLSWNDMGFENEAVELAYDKTILKCKELKWPYMNKILLNWHQKGLHTVEAIRQGDQAGQKVPAHPRPSGGGADSVREDLARMERYRQQLREQNKGKEET